MVESGKRGYYVNLDPAVKGVSFGVNIDIRDTVNYKEVMKQYGLGPNGAILTSLNLFATRFDQVVGKVYVTIHGLLFVNVTIEKESWSEEHLSSIIYSLTLLGRLKHLRGLLEGK